jgi:protein CpxP
MKHRNLILATLLTGGLTTAGFAGISLAGADGGQRHCDRAEHMGYGKHQRDPVQRLMKHIELTDAQQAEIKSLTETSRAGSGAPRKQLRENRKAMHELVSSDAYSIDQLRVLADRQARLQADLTVARIDTMHRVHQVLTPEQRAELKALRDQRRAKHQHRMEEQDD